MSDILLTKIQTSKMRQNTYKVLTLSVGESVGSNVVGKSVGEKVCEGKRVSGVSNNSMRARGRLRGREHEQLTGLLVGNNVGNSVCLKINKTCE